MSTKKDTIVKVTLDLETIVLNAAKNALKTFPVEHPVWKENIYCPLEDISLALNDLVRDYFNRIQAKGMKSKAANACGISDRTQRNYENRKSK